MITWEFLGRLHPLILHLPIGLIFGLILIEGLSFIVDRSARAWQICRNAYITLLSLSCVAAAMTGYLLSLEGQDDGVTLVRHKWLGLAVAGLSLVLFVLAVKRHGSKGLVQAALRFVLVFGLFAMILVTGHLGGQLTHGPHYLSTHAPPALQPFLGPPAQEKGSLQPIAASVTVYGGMIQPILETHCIFCHGGDRQKGQLAMHTQEALMAGGRSGAAVLFETPQHSEFLKRIRLPLEEAGHMPPEGKSQLSSLQMSALQWWIEAGAPYDASVKQNEIPQELTGLLPQTVPPVGQSIASGPVQWDEALLRRLTDQQISIQRIKQDDQRLWVSFPAIADQVTDDTIQQLLALSPFIAWLDLANTRITSQSLQWIANMPELTKLDLRQTNIDTQALSSLRSHKTLERLNLSQVPLDDTVVDLLLGMPNLKRVYLWESQVSEAGIRRLLAPRIEVISESEPSAVISTDPNDMN